MQKLDGEMKAVSALGHNVYFISFDKDFLYLNKFSNEQNHSNNRCIISKTTLGNSKLYYHLVSFYDIYRLAKNVIDKKNIDIVYFRYSPLNSVGYRFCRYAGVNGKLVVEIPTYTTKEETPKNIMRKMYTYWSKFWWKHSSKYVSFFTLIGEKADLYLGRPAINIDNGIYVENIPPRQNENSSDKKIHLLAVASMSTWHGYDRLIQGFSNWNSPLKSRYIIDLVGDEGDGSLANWKKLVRECGLEKQVIFHGRLTGDKLTHMYNQATIGIASLGMYRNNLFSGSILKLREYMARGLPFVYAHNDPDIKENMPWCLKMPNNDTPIDMEQINGFVDAISKNRDLSGQMRQYAIDNMTWETQFRKVFKKLYED